MGGRAYGPAVIGSNGRGPIRRAPRTPEVSLLRDAAQAGSAATRSERPVVYSDEGGRHYVGCRLHHLFLPSVSQGPETNALADFQRRQAEFLACLTTHGPDRFTYDLRILSTPDPTLWPRGQVTVALLCRTDRGGPEESERHGVQLLHLLEAFFPEYAFELASADEVRSLLHPFPVKHLAEVTRRTSVERLDTLSRGQPRSGLGFLRAENLRSGLERPSDAVLHVFPYLPTSAPFDSLFSLLLLKPTPLAISVRLRPTALTALEASFLEEQIARCERYAQAGLEPVLGDLSAVQPTLREQARLYQEFQLRTLHGLKASAALMALEMASPAPIPLSVLNAVGSLVTEPPGGTHGRIDQGPHRFLAGGYDVRYDDGADPARVQSFEQLEVVASRMPPEAGRLLHLFDPVEATAAFRFPRPTAEGLPGLEVCGWRTQRAPRDLPMEGLLLGRSVHRAAEQPVRIRPDDRRRHLYVVGQTGTGKTTLLETMILDDMRTGKGICVVDPHGDLLHGLLGKIPEERIDDVVLLDPTDAEHPVGLNMLEYETETQRHFLVQELVGILARLVEDEYGLESFGQIAGPVFFQHMRMNLLLAMSNPADPGTLLEFYTIYQEAEYWRRWLPLKLSDPLLARWVEHVLPKTDYTRPGSDGPSMGGYVGSKFEGFVFDPLLRRVFGQKRSTIDLRAVMDQGRILLVNLAKGELTEANARFLGMVLLAKLMAAAMGRVRMPEGERREFHLYVDEFQSLATQSFVTLLSEARKFGVSLILANQFLAQVKDPRIVRAIFGNVGTLVCFRLGQADAELMEREFHPAISRFDLCNVPNWHAYMKTLINGQTAPPFSIQTLPDPTPFDLRRAETVRAWSRSKYGRPRAAVEEEIARSLAWPVEGDEDGDEA